MDKIYLPLGIIFLLYLGQSLLRNGIRGIKEKDKPFGLYNPRFNVIYGIIGIISGLILLIRFITTTLF
jgi:hypothetical protein